MSFRCSKDGDTSRWTTSRSGSSRRPRCSTCPRPARAGATLPVVVVSDRSHRFGVVVDAFLGERDLEVRPLDPRLGKVPDISSASVLEDGVPVLIFDVEDLVRSIDNLLGGRRLRVSALGDAGAAGPEAREVRSGSWSSTTRSRSASSSASCSKRGATPSMSPSTASTAGTPSAAGSTSW